MTKLFPANVTEQRFLEVLEKLCDSRIDLDYSDERETGHTLTDFGLSEKRKPIYPLTLRLLVPASRNLKTW